MLNKTRNVPKVSGPIDAAEAVAGVDSRMAEEVKDPTEEAFEK